MPAYEDKVLVIYSELFREEVLTMRLSYASYYLVKWAEIGEEVLVKVRVR